MEGVYKGGGEVIGSQIDFVPLFLFLFFPVLLLFLFLLVKAVGNNMRT